MRHPIAALRAYTPSLTLSHLTVFLGLLALALGGLRAAHAVGTVLHPGDLLVVDNRAFSTGAVIQVDPVTGGQTDVTHDGLLRNPGGLALDLDGSIVVADTGASGIPPPRIIRVTPASGAQEIVTSGDLLNAPIGIVVAANGHFYIADAGIPGVVEYNPVTSQQSLLTSGGSLVTPEHLTIGPDGFLYIADASLPGVVKVNPSNGQQSVVPHDAPLDSVYGLAFDSAGALYVTQIATGEIFRIKGGSQTLLTGTGYFNIPIATAWNAAGHLIVCDRASGVGGVWALNPNGNGQPTLISSGGLFARTQDVVVVPHPAPLTGDLLVADSDYGAEGGVIRVDGNTHLQNVVSARGYFEDPVGIAVESGGDLLVVDANALGGSGALIRVNPSTGSQQIVSSGQYFIHPSGLAVAENGDIYVVDVQSSPLPDDPNNHQGAVIRVNPVTGEQTLVSGGGVGQGVSFLVPSGIALQPDGQIVVIDEARMVLRVDPVTGDRSLRSFDQFFESPVGIAVEINGDYDVADADAFPLNGENGGVIRVHADGTQSALSQRGSFVSPQGVTIAPGGDLLIADSDAEGGTGAVIQVDPASGGQVILTSHGNFSEPKSIAVVPYAAPIALDDVVSTYRNTPVMVAVLGNDSGAAGGSAVKTSEPQHGTATLTPDGQAFVYTPSAGYVGDDSFTYRASLNGSLSNTATVDITVVNRAPVAVNDSYTGWQNCTVQVAAPGVLGNDTDADGDSLIATVAALPSGGSLTLNPNGSFLYTPNPGTTSDSFTYRAHDGLAYSEPATVTLTLAADTIKPACSIGAVVVASPTRVYLPITLTDSQSGVTAVQLTTQSSNCVLEAPDGTTAPVGGTLNFDPAEGTVVVKAVKLNPSQKARMELRVTDCAGNWLLCDPVIAELVIPRGGRTVTGTYPGLPEAEHYFTAQNDRPGVDQVQVRVNRTTPRELRLKPGVIKTLDVARALRVGNSNTLTVRASGRPGSRVLIMIGDAAPGGVTVRILNRVHGVNIEFAP